jgi:C1A family cysteine protease
MNIKARKSRYKKRQCITLIALALSVIAATGCSQSQGPTKPTTAQPAVAQPGAAQPAGSQPGEHHHAKGGLLERPSKERVQKFRAAAEHALQEYWLKLQLTVPKTQQLSPSGVPKPKPGAGARPASPADPVFSWRPLIMFNTNEDQGTCGSCYIFAGVGALEESWAKQHPSKNILASQQLVLNCVGTCSGGYLSTVVEFLTGKGTSKAVANVYTGVPAGCTFTPPLPYQTLAGDYVASDGGMPSEADLKAAILKYGPVGAFIYAGGSFDSWWNKKEPSVIVDDSSGADNGHLILITGWNDNPDVNAWEIKNSWGPTWGDNGFGYVRKGIRDIGDNAMWVVAIP